MCSLVLPCRLICWSVISIVFLYWSVFSSGLFYWSIISVVLLCGIVISLVLFYWSVISLVLLCWSVIRLALFCWSVIELTTLLVLVIVVFLWLCGDLPFRNLVVQGWRSAHPWIMAIGGCFHSLSFIQGSFLGCKGSKSKRTAIYLKKYSPESFLKKRHLFQNLKKIKKIAIWKPDFLSKKIPSKLNQGT